jgi:hypothetical protein
MRKTLFSFLSVYITWHFLIFFFLKSEAGTSNGQEADLPSLPPSCLIPQLKGTWNLLDIVFFSVSLELLYLRGLGTEKEQVCRNGPPGYIDWRNRFTGINYWAP